MNTVLKYAIRYHAGQTDTPPCNIINTEPLPLPPVPGHVDCIVAGFPWYVQPYPLILMLRCHSQSFSGLNRFKHSHARKSHLILTLLSWVDFLRPKYCLFENVRGFLSYGLHASSDGRHRAKGEIGKGGLKFIVSALIAMG